MLMSKNIIEMEENLIFHPEARKRSDTLKTDKLSPTELKTVSLAIRRASVPMEIIIGKDGRPVFNAAASSPTTTTGGSASPVTMTEPKTVLTEKREVRRTISKELARSNSKKRNSSKSKKKEIKKKGEEKESPNTDETPLITSLATCTIGSMAYQRRKSIEHLPEYQIQQKNQVTVRDAFIQTD